MPRQRSMYKTTVLVSALLTAALGATAQPLAPSSSATALKAAVEKALASNPEVAARFSAYRASVDAVDVAQAAWKPKLDMTGRVGRDQDRISSRTPQGNSVSSTSLGLTLSQLLWDGHATRNEVNRAGHERLTRYFDLLDLTEQTALEVARAHYDVLRYRRLVQLAEDNYVQHKYAAIQIQSRFQAGVGRGVDLEQANARLALAESNLATEIANLHDVTARYQRIVGEVPPPQLPPSSKETAPLKQAIPGRASEAVTAAVRQSASISASIESLRASRAASLGADSAFQPRVEARLRTGGGKNLDGVTDQTRNSTAEIVMNWNLYNGGADQARTRQQTHLVTQAADLRDKVCRDTRQTTSIAFNDTRKLAEQLTYLDRNALAIEKARDAYRQQFDIGQRSLLDLLNAENELYTAKRSYANAEHDLGIAYARVHAAMNQLVSQLGLAKPAADAPEAAGWTAGDDAPGRCPTETTEISGTARSELDARAQRITNSVPAVTPVKK
jgi:adhesin transport system outer membrane protein